MSNGMTVSEFLDEIQTPIKKLTITQLRQREEFWRALWSWTDPTVKDFLIHAGTLTRLVKRNYQGSTGELGEVKFEPTEIDLYVYEKSFNYNDNKYYYERKVLHLDAAALLWHEFITERELAEEAEAPELEAIPEEADVT